jgi:hypothetical protein
MLQKGDQLKFANPAAHQRAIGRLCFVGDPFTISPNKIAAENHAAVVEFKPLGRVNAADLADAFTVVNFTAVTPNGGRYSRRQVLVHGAARAAGRLGTISTHNSYLPWPHAELTLAVSVGAKIASAFSLAFHPGTEQCSRDLCAGPRFIDPAKDYSRRTDFRRLLSLTLHHSGF